MTRQKLYQITIFVLLLVMGVMGSYVFVQQRSLAQTLFKQSQMQKFYEPIPLASSATSDPADPADFFSNYASWPTSTTPKQNDYMKHVLYTLYLSRPSSNLQYVHTFTDINGDGLTDFLTVWFGQFMAVFLNGGNNNFIVGYKCVMQGPYNYDYTYYGDCAEF